MIPLVKDIMTQEQSLHAVTDSEKAMLDLIQNKRFLDLERVPLICSDIADINRDMAEIKGMLKTQVVTQDQFWPVKVLVYGFVGLSLVAVIGGLLALVIKK